MESKQSSRPKIGAFSFHGVDLTERQGTGQAVGSCPFCGKDDHFFVDMDTGLWKCHSGTCTTTGGNVYAFIQALHAQALEVTKPDHYKALSILRKGIPPSIFKTWKLACSDINAFPIEDGPGWLIPVWNDKGVMANLLRWDGNGSPLGTTGLHQHLYTLDGLPSDPKTPVYICEGQWDTLAMAYLLTKTKKPGVAIGVPGCGVFKKDWPILLKGYPLSLLYDNDNAGSNGMDRACQLLSNGSPLSRIQWPATFKEGYDLNDFIADRLKSPGRCWDQLHKMLVPVVHGKVAASGVKRVKPTFAETGTTDLPSSPEKRKGKPPTFKQLLKVYRTHLHLDANVEDTLAVMFAAALSIQIAGDPIWLFIVGPPGAGKTLILRSMESSDRCVFISSLTPHCMVSGYKLDGDDPSLIPQWIGRTVVLKDYTEIKGMNQQAQEEIYGVLRGAYDGCVDKMFGNGVRRVYTDCHFAMVAGVTHVIHGDTRATLGERFLKFEMLREGHDPEKHIRAALNGFNKAVDVEAVLRSIASRFLDQPIPGSVIRDEYGKDTGQRKSGKLPKVPEWIIARTIALSQVIAYLRAGVDREKGEMVYRPRPEIGTRLAKQLVKLGQALAIVTGVKTLDYNCYRLMERTAFDTATGWHLDVIKVLMEKGSHEPLTNFNMGLTTGRNGGKKAKRKLPKKVKTNLQVDGCTYAMSTNDLAAASAIAKTSLENKLKDLVALKAVRIVKLTAQGPGRPDHGYIVTHELASLWKSAKVGQK